jgi:hypothetical protein
VLALLHGHVTVNRLKTALEKLPDKLDDAYESVMERIFTQDEERQVVAKTALTWITFAKERLTIDGLLDAVALGLDPDLAELDGDDLVDVDVLLASCLGLAVLNKEDKVIRLVHYTTQPYLEKKFPKVDANATLARASMKYLSFQPWIDWTKYLVNDGLFRYGSRHWAEHVREGGEEGLAFDVIRFLESPKNCDRLLVMGEWQLSTGGSTWWNQPPAMPHFLSQYGLSVVFRTYLMEVDKINGNAYNIP